MGGDCAAAGLVLALLGPVEIGPAGGAMAPVAQPRLRVLLGLLGVAGGRVVSAEALVDGLWGEEWSPGREKNLHALVYQLRRRLAALDPGNGRARLARAGAGYRLALGPGELDVDVFRDLAGRGREAARAGDAERARELFGQALGCWRGAALADAAPVCPRLAGEAARLEEARLAVVEERIGADLALGRHGEVAGELAGLVEQFPLRERLAVLLMTALYRCGRRGEALAVFDGARRVLAGELGLDPGPELAGLQAQVLADDPALAAPAAAPGGAPPPQVGIFTFLFTDIDGSTALLRRLGEAGYADVLAGHHALVRSGLAAHGGEEVETRRDGFFAVFSSPSACVAAAMEMQRAIAARTWPGGDQVRVRIGIHTGEASKTAVGLVGLDVHRAARVAAVAYGGQVLLSETAAALARDSLPPGAGLRDLGVHQLKDLGQPERIFQLDAAGLQAVFPPLRSLDHPALPNNLPTQLATFIGRDRELSEVRALVESSRLVTLTGAGGAGKTRLSLQVAAELLGGSGDGAWLVELAAVSDAEEVPSAISAALGIREQPGRAALEGLLDALALQDVLIVLDNCEHLIGACAKAADAIVRRCPRVHLLATSREPLGIGGETLYRVPSLSLPGPDDVAPGSSDAVALLVERAREQGVDLPVDEETGPLLVSVCRRLDGLPLAIELAAARLRSLSLRGLCDRLDQRFRLLTGGSRIALARQQTLRATVDWSYSLLSGPEQSLLRLLSVFAGSFDLDAAEGVCGAGGIEAFDLADLLGSLVDKSLVAAEPAGGALRYRLLETIRQYAAERLAEAGEHAATAARAEHCAYFLGVAEAAAPHLTGPEQGRWLARLDADYPNLRRAAEFAASDPARAGPVLRFGVALRRYWWARSRNSEGLALLLPVLERPEARANPGLLGAALVTATQVSQFADLAPTRRLGEQAVEVGRELRDDRLLVDALGFLSSAYFFLGEPDRGLPLGQEAVDRARQLGDDVLLGQSLLVYLLFHDLIGPARSRRLLAEAISCTERSGDQFMRYALHNNAAVRALMADDIPATRAHLEQAAHASRAIGFEGPHVLNLGWVRRAEGDLDGARSMFEAFLRVSRRNGEQPGMGYAILGLACLAADLGDWDQAAMLHGVAQAFSDRSGQPWEEPSARYRRDSLAQVRAHLGNEQFDRAYGRGTTLPADEALRSALGQSPQPSPPGAT